MSLNKSFVKINRKGNVVKIVKEHYLRDDIWCNSEICQVCKHEAPKLKGTAPHYLVLDTNVFIHQMDVVENFSSDTNVIVLQTVLEELKHLNLSLHNRLRKLLADQSKLFSLFSNEHHKETFVERQPSESPNDRNDRAIRVCADWFSRHLQASSSGGISIIVLTHDFNNKRMALEQGLQVMSLREYVQAYHPTLSDLVAEVVVESSSSADPSPNAAPSSRHSTFLYPEHLSSAAINSGLKDGRLHQGHLRTNPYNCFEAYVFLASLEQEVLIRGRENLNRAMDGDLVVLHILPKSQWKRPSDRVVQDDNDDDDYVPPTASTASDAAPPSASPMSSAADGVQITAAVVGIIKRNWRQYCGCIAADADGKVPGGDRVLFIAVDRRVPKIRIQTRQAAALARQRIVVAIDSWDRSSRYPSGHYVRTIGPVGDKEAETDVLLTENEIPVYPFSANCLACLPPAPWDIAKEDLSFRRDFRQIRVCSIDPPGCKDIDDALHCRPLPNNNFEVAVHIADVSHFVKTGTALDEEAAVRSTSVYLVGRRIDMLPSLLTTDICSLVGQQERLVFSVVWELTPEAKIVNVAFCKGIIKSVAALSYGEAQNRIDDPKMQDDLTHDLRNLNKLAKHLKQQRIAAGALSLASPEVKFEINPETQDPMEMALYETKEANSLVEEFMLLANVSVAEKILQHFPNVSVLRRHPAPMPRAFDQLVAACKARGISLEVHSSLALARSLDNAHLAGHAYLNKLIRMLSTRCMNQAVYFCSGVLPYAAYHHYGLACAIYTHFTSPIRRYADILVHRLLAACLQLESLPEPLQDKQHVSDKCDVMNQRHLMAQRAGRASVNLHTLLFFRGRTEVDDALIIRIKSNGVVVLVPRYGIEGIVYLNVEGAKSRHDFAPTAAAPMFRYDGAQDALIGTGVSSGVTLRMFDQIRVSICVEAPQQHRQELVLRLATHTAPSTTAPLPLSIPSPCDAGAADSPAAANGTHGTMTPPGDASRKRQADELRLHSKRSRPR